MAFTFCAINHSERTKWNIFCSRKLYATTLCESESFIGVLFLQRYPFPSVSVAFQVFRMSFRGHPSLRVAQPCWSFALRRYKTMIAFGILAF